MHVKVEQLREAELLAAAQLIERSFDDSIAPILSEEGIATFKRGLTSESLKKRLDSGNLFLVCRDKNSMVGVGEIRNGNHLNLFFVDPGIQRCGIGRKIFEGLLGYIRASKVTVNSSLNSIDAYKRFGFVENGSRSEVKGIRFQPMIYKNI